MPDHAAEVLVDPTSLNYIMPLPEMFVGMAQHAKSIVHAHRSGTGVSWEQFGDEVRDSQAAFNRAMFMSLLGNEYIPLITDVHERLTGDTGARIADIACGGGWSSIAMAKAYPNVQVDGFDIDEPSIKLAQANAASENVSDRTKFHHADAANTMGSYDLVLICEALHDLPQPVPVLDVARKLAGIDGAVIVMDERVAEKFEAPANEIDRLMLGISNWVCLPDSMSSQPSVATGTAMRPDTLRTYAFEAGFREVEILPIENDFFRFYRLRS
jgi:SAM-dependent methyltransferase